MSSQDPVPSPPRLPNEIILHIIESLIPTGHSAIALPASNPITKTLLALARTSTLTRPTALRLLYTHCLYIDNLDRLSDLTDTLQKSLKYEECREIQANQLKHEISKRSRYHLRSNDTQLGYLPHFSLHTHVTSIYLAPISSGTAEKLQDVQDICQLLELVGPTVTRLMLAVPPVPMQNIHHTYDGFGDLVSTLQKMKSLEVFFSFRDDSWQCDLFRGFKSHDNVAYIQWPKLKVMSLFKPIAVQPNMWKWYGAMEALERAIIVCPSGLCDLPKIDYKQLYIDGQRGRGIPKKLEVIVMGQDKLPAHLRAPEELWKQDDVIQFRNVTVGVYSSYSEQVLALLNSGY